jgi:PAS domain S-box-containing protein
MPIDRLLGAAGSALPGAARFALDELIGACLATNPSGTISGANDAAAELLGVPTPYLVGKPVQTFVPASHRRSVRGKITEVASGPLGLSTFTTRVERRGGVAFEAEIRAARVDDDALVLAIRDITQAVQTESHLWELNTELEERIAERTAELELLSAELERRNAYLETIMQHMPTGLVLAEADTGEVTMMSERAVEISRTPLPAMPLAQATWRNMPGTREDGRPYGPDEWPLARALAGETVARERIFVERAGRRQILEINAAPVRDQGGEVIAAVALFEDVTAADARARAAAEFVANAAHELRTPLAAIVSGIDVLEAGAKDIPAERDRFLAHVSREAARLARLSSALLQLARLQSGVEQPRTEIVALAPVIASVVAGLRPADGVHVEVRCANTAAAVASRGLLEQALTSVATNAARYTATGRIMLSVAQPNGRVRIRVRDTGRGMEPETLARAGERFFRGHPTGPAGFGLGLAIARESVEAMGGSLVIESAPGEGTTADIVLPAAQVVAT